MFTIRVNWMNPSFPVYSVYQTDKYAVSNLPDGGKEIELSDGDRQIRISGGDIAYVMNDRGTTIDTIRTSDKLSPPL